MNFEVVSEFERSLKRLSKKYPSLKADYEALLKELEKILMLGMKFFQIVGRCAWL